MLDITRSTGLRWCMEAVAGVHSTHICHPESHWIHYHESLEGNTSVECAGCVKLPESVPRLSCHYVCAEILNMPGF